MLADEIMAARGSRYDEGGILSSFAGVIERAQRFELHDDVVTAALNLCRNRPSSLLEMQPFCRLSYPKMWVEWSRKRQLEFYSPLAPDYDGPSKIGCLLEYESDQIVFASQVWGGEFNGERRVYACPYGVMFDLSADGALLRKFANTKLEEDLVKVHQHYDDNSAEKLRSDQDWQRFSKLDTEIQALAKLSATTVCMPSIHAYELLMREMTTAEKRLRKQEWQEELQGLSYIVRAVITLFNCRNGLAQQPVDRGKVNKHRIRSGKPPLLPYVTTTMKLSAAQQRHAEAQGIDRATARQHLVRGHPKNIRGNMYWWSPHLRGDPLRPIARQKYLMK
jgi:hypothetical protein